jgi:alpha-D-xyloside xylohydrolase
MFGDKASEIVTEFANLRYRLLPYYLSYGCEAAATGVPIMRPMALEFEDYQQTSTSATQHMVGEEFLVAPVLSADGQVRVDLPPGEWVHYWSGEYHTGPECQTLELDLDELPFFVRAESIIPEDPSASTHTDGPPAELRYRVYPARTGETTTQFTVRHPEVPRPGSIEVEIDESWQAVTVTTSGNLPPGTVTVEAAANFPNSVVVDSTELNSDEVEYNTNEEVLTFEIGY